MTQSSSSAFSIPRERKTPSISTTDLYQGNDVCIHSIYASFNISHLSAKYFLLWSIHNFFNYFFFLSPSFPLQTTHGYSTRTQVRYHNIYSYKYTYHFFNIMMHWCGVWVVPRQLFEVEQYLLLCYLILHIVLILLLILPFEGPSHQLLFLILHQHNGQLSVLCVYRTMRLCNGMAVFGNIDYN